MYDVDVLGPRVLNGIPGDVDSTSIIIVQQLPTAIYSASVVEKDIKACFLLVQATRLFPT